MKIITYGLLFFLTIPIFSCAIGTGNIMIVGGLHCDPRYKATGPLLKQARSLHPFTKVNNQSAIDISIVVGHPQQEVIVEAQESLLPQIQTIVTGEKLIISINGPYCSTEKQTITLLVPMLTGIENAGSGDIQAQNIVSSSFDLDVLSSGDVTIQGKTPSLQLNSAGSGDINLQNFQAQNVNLQQHSSGTVKLCVSQNMIGKTTSSGDLQVTCNPQNVILTKAGSGDVDIQSLQGNSAQITTSGSGDVTVSGKIQTLEATVTGSGDLHAKNLQSQFATVYASASGDVQICAQQEIKGSRSGSGDLDVFCNPKIHQVLKSGSGDLNNH